MGPSSKRGRGKQLVSPRAPQSSGGLMMLLWRPLSALPAESNRGLSVTAEIPADRTPVQFGQDIIAVDLG
jgi:hypothetical protein